MKRPTFFISSTIYDFHDLRSALKFYLEENGCEVLASEFNDFTKPLDTHSYEACLQSIQSADYFILLIGNRVGGWYDKPNEISITQREYREAYRLHSAGKLKLLNFVRADVWQVREDRHELAKYLQSLDIPEESRKAIVNYPSKFAADANYLSQFIAEVGRIHETKLSVQGNSPAPTGNWIHVFARFRDIVDVLNGQVFSSTPVEDMTTKRLLRRELHEIVTRGLLKFNGNVLTPHDSVALFHYECPLTLESKRNSVTSVPAQRWRSISALSICLLARQFHATVLPQLLSNPTFLRFDLESNSYKETPVYEALLLLQDEIRRFNRANTADTLSVVYENLTPNLSINTQSFVDVETIKLGALLHLLDRWCNILNLSCALIRHLDGNAFEMPQLWPFSPVQGMQVEIDRETATSDDVDAYINAT